jgi:hypothetical protein
MNDHLHAPAALPPEKNKQMVLAAAEEKISYTCQDFGSAGHVTVVK